MKKNKLLVLLFAMLLVATTPFLGQALSASADTYFEVEQKRYSNATIDADFADNAVMVILTKEATNNQKGTAAAAAFTDTSFSKVEDLTATTETLIEKQAVAKRTGNWGELESRKERGMLVDENNFRKILRIELEENSKENVLSVIKQLEKREDVLYAGPDYIVKPAAVPNPTPTNYSEQWYVDYLNLEEAWDITTGSASVTVGVIDTGMDAAHPDLMDRVNGALSRDFSAANGITTTFDPPEDPGFPHGTHVSGTIGANRNSNNPNGATPGVIGICWDVTLVSLRCWGDTEFSSNMVRAIIYATSNESGGIDIINISGRQYPDWYWYDESLEESISQFPGLVVCAAGNENNNNDTSPCYPAAHELDNLVTVGALTMSGSNVIKAGFSNYGENTVDIWAPGTAIYSTVPASWGSYDSWDGTSMATPVV